MASNNTVLVVAAHSDDEALGCAGTIAKHVDSGDDVFVVFMTDGVTARGSSDGSDERFAASEAALSVLGITKTFRFDFPDNNMDSVPLLRVVKRVEEAIEKVHPSIIYTHYAYDLNIDHRITNQAVMTACRPQQSCSVKEIYTFEVLSSTEWASTATQPFIPQLIVDISDYWDQKMKALRCYCDEMRKFPHSRSYDAVEALAILRGCTHGVGKAEAFHIERVIR